jgi:hypothetical protein
MTIPILISRETPKGFLKVLDWDQMSKVEKSDPSCNLRLFDWKNHEIWIAMRIEKKKSRL